MTYGKHIVFGAILVGIAAVSMIKYQGVMSYPNPEVTPGLVNSAITQENIGDNICNPHWTTKSIRPSSSYTSALKTHQLSSLNSVYYLASFKTSDFEEDHLISLVLGGNPTDPKNLWPQKYAKPYGAREKDHLENVLHSMVCSGSISLKEAQFQISHDWVSAYDHYVLPIVSKRPGSPFLVKLGSYFSPPFLESYPSGFQDEDDED